MFFYIYFPSYFVYVIDTSAVFLRKIPEKSVTVPEVVDEIIDEESKLYFQISNVRVECSRPEYVLRIKRVAKETGDVYRLSNTDVKVLAKALELKEKGFEVSIVTDDYSIQNVAKVIGVGIESIIQKGISKAFKWVKVCKGCGRKVEGDVCPVCGSEVVLRRVRSEKARRSRSKSKKAKRKGFDDWGNS